MRHVSWWVVAVVLGSVPFAATAADYGANAALLAVTATGAQLSSAQMHAAASADASADGAKQAMPQLDVSGGETAEGDAAPPPHRPLVLPSNGEARSLGASASNKGHAALAHRAPARAPATASWQSLLPGSIQ